MNAQLLQGLQGDEVIADDILVYGSGNTQEEYTQDHDNNLTKLLEQARAVNLKLNCKKLKLCLGEGPIHGLLIDERWSTCRRSKAITKMPRPQENRGF